MAKVNKRTPSLSHYLYVDALARGVRIEKIPCRVFLDSGIASRSRVVLTPSREVGMRLLEGNTWSLFGVRTQPRPGPPGYLHVPRFVIESVKTRRWAPGLDQTRVFGKASAIIIVTALRGARRSKARVYAALHGGSIVAPHGFETTSHVGTIAFRRAWRCRARVKPDSLVWFDQYTMFPRSGPRSGLRQLVLRADTASPLGGPQIALSRYRDSLEDALSLVSIAGRERASWHRLVGSDGHVTIEYFDTQRRPPSPSRHGLGPLVSQYDLGGFLEACFSRLRRSPARNELIAAGWMLAPFQDQVLDSSFVAMFSCLEAIVVRLNRGPIERSVLDLARWHRLSRDLKRVIRDWQDDAGTLSRPQRVAMYGKLLELNRTPFKSAWMQFHTDRGIPVHDLWPVSASDGLVDLTEIRNRLAHGQLPAQVAAHSLAHAVRHLRITLERVVVSALEFDLASTEISPTKVFGHGVVSDVVLRKMRAAATLNWFGLL